MQTCGHFACHVYPHAPFVSYLFHVFMTTVRLRGAGPFGRPKLHQSDGYKTPKYAIVAFRRFPKR